MSTNVYWYLMLFLFSLMFWAIIYIKKRQKGSWILFLIAVELAYLFETVMSIFLKCYEYYPQIINYDRYYDNNVGAMFSNLLAVPTVVTFITIFRLKFKWKAFFILAFAAIEMLFLSIKIYSHFWWRTEYTSISLLVYFFLVEKAYQKLKSPMKGVWHSSFLFLCIAPLEGTVHILPIMLFCSRVYNIGWFQNAGRNTTAFESIWYLVFAAIQVAIIKSKMRYKPLKYLLVISVGLFIDFVLTTADVLDSLIWWDSIVFILSTLIVFKVGEVISAKLSKGIFTSSTDIEKASTE